MTDLNVAIRTDLDDNVLVARDGGEFVAAENYLVMTRALRAVLDLAGEMCGDGDLHDTNAHACGGRGEPDCALCAAQSIQFVIARELGIKEES
ncbi:MULTISPECIES: hypothetical protein [unclassified Saccharopolyspora]|uniref:hypothetical protein n=1 Tax=unclassified Saccharopolyspora TaxID=2646250 RepID=UPI001CD70E9F|nr:MULTISPECIES: hypothetical protein [unclassified Saccharopolyspora]MCA1185775.1 hypothetical protein [Saccharopolyspora sp. 6T]MCA1191687.1 hypothetical protein [Saccharopolyspora sp. 6V]